MPVSRTCPECGAELSLDAAEGLCPKCLLKGGIQRELSTSQPDTGVVAREAASSADSDSQAETVEGPKAAGEIIPGSTIKYFGDYEILEEIARGGMGVVFKARQVSLNRTVAVKMILSGQLAGEANIKRFRSEAEAVANLQHSNIVALHEVGEHEGQHYFSMDFVEGKNLAQCISDFGLPILDSKKPATSSGWTKSRIQNQKSKIATLLMKVAQAVHYAHQRGILHRDLKPGNILIDSDDEPHVTDFGLAKRLEVESDLTHTGAIMGTPNYMAPEQARGVKQLSTAVDVYSLGAILYQLLTGRPPFQADTPVETLRVAAEQEPTYPSVINSNVDRDLETICLKCLEKNPDRRYESAAALAEELERWSNQEPILARPSSAWERTVKWTKRKPAIAALTVAVVLTALVGAVGIIWQWQLTTSATERANILLIESWHKEGIIWLERAQSKLGEKDYFTAKLMAARAIGFDGFGRDERQETFREGRNPVLLKTDSREFVTASTIIRSYPTYAPIWISPSQIQINGQISGGNRGSNLKDARTGEPIVRYIGHSGGVTSLSFSSDGSLLASGSGDRTVRLWDVATGKEQNELHGHSQQVLSVRFSPDGGLLATMGRSWETSSSGTDRRNFTEYIHYRIILWDIESGELRTEIVHRSRPLENSIRAWDSGLLEFGPNGDVLVSYGEDGTIQLWDAATGAQKGELKGHTDTVLSLDFSYGGSRLYATTANGTCLSWDVATGQLGNVLKPEGDGGQAVTQAFDVESGSIAAGTVTGLVTIRDLDREDLVDDLSGHTGEVRSLDFSLDGERLASASEDNSILLWEVDGSDEPIAKLKGHTGSVNSVSFSPDGTLLASGGADGTVRLWDLTIDAQTAEFDWHTDPNKLNPIGFSQDGNLLITGDTSWDLMTGEQRSEFRIWESKILPEQITQLSSSQGSYSFPNFTSNTFIIEDSVLVLVNYEGVNRLLDGATGEEKAKFEELLGQVRFPALSPDGLLMATFDYGHNSIFLWDVETGKQKSEFMFPRADGRSHEDVIIFSPDGSLIARTAGDEILVCETVTRKPKAKFKEEFSNVSAGRALCFSRDGKLLASGSSDGTIHLWDLESGNMRSEMNSLPLVESNDSSKAVIIGRALAFSPDGKLLASGNTKGVIRLWDVATGKVRAEFKSQSDYIHSVSFNPDGSLLAAGENGVNSLQVWDVAKLLNPSGDFAFYLRYFDFSDREVQWEKESPNLYLPRSGMPAHTLTSNSYVSTVKDIENEAERNRILFWRHLVKGSLTRLGHPQSARIFLDRIQKTSSGEPEQEALIKEWRWRGNGILQFISKPTGFPPVKEVKMLAKRILEVSAEARLMADRILELAPDSPEGWRLKARAEFALKNWSGASTALDRALELDSDNATLLELKEELIQKRTDNSED